VITQEIRETIIDMHQRGIGAGNIAAVVGIAENLVGAVTAQIVVQAPPLVRREKPRRNLLEAKPDVPWVNPENLGVEENWEVEGLCRTGSYDPDLWFPNPAESSLVRLAQKVCYRCPVIVECRSMALARGERNGIWGGLTEAQRKRMKKQECEEEAEAV
jgi:WhiB family redox-sensing transcriptional regulator